MNIIFLGNIVPPAEIGKYSAGSVAGNKMQYYLLKYLSQMEGVNLEIVSSYSHAAFPKDKLFIKGAQKELFENVKIHQLSYINLPIVKQLVLIHKHKKMVKKLCKKHQDSIVFSYDLYPMQGNALRKAVKKQNVKGVCLLADLSIGGVKAHKGIKKYLQKIYDRLTLKNLKSCPNYVVLNENIITQYIPNANYIVVQGGVEPSEYPLECAGWNGKEKNILYTGALVDYSGIMTLIDAMGRLEDTKAVLDIYGNGPLEKAIVEKTREMKNVRFHGSTSNSEILKLQRSAWLLINPRPVDNCIAKVTFPSKIFEYMMSGRPVLSTKLNGFTEEYKDKIFWVEDDSVQGLVEAIRAMLRLTEEELEMYADNALNFMIKHKAWEENTKSIYDFLKVI